MTKPTDAPKQKDQGRKGNKKPDQQARREASEALRARQTAHGDSRDTVQASTDKTSQRTGEAKPKKVGAENTPIQRTEKKDSTKTTLQAGERGKTNGKPRVDQQQTGHLAGKELGKDLVKLLGKTVSQLESLSSQKSLTRLEQASAQTSRLINKVAEAVASRASDKTAQQVIALGDKIQSPLSQPAGERLRALGSSTGLKWSSRALSGLTSAIEAHERGEGLGTSAVEGALKTAVGERVKDLYSKASGMAGIDTIVNAIDSVAKKVSPKAAEYTGIAADMTPSKVANQFTGNAVEVYSALLRGDGDRAIKQQEKMLAGEFGNVIRGYAIASESIGALVTRDARALNQLSDMASGGKLGKPALLGDRIGDAVFNLLHRNR